LKARNVASSIGTSGNYAADQSYLLTDNLASSTNNTTNNNAATLISGSRKKYQNFNSTSDNTNNNNNKSIAFLLLPPLIFLFFCEMSSSLPLMVLLCCGLIVYAFDLANVGSSNPNESTTTQAQQQQHKQQNQQSSRNQSNRGYYTLCAIWMSWLLLSLVVGYDGIFLEEERTSSASSSAAMNDAIEGGDGPSNNGSMTANLFELSLLLAKLAMSILLLFNLATWTTLQFTWLPTRMPMVARFLERILCATLPPVSAATVSYGMLVTAGGGGSSYGGHGLLGTDGMATLVPYVFAFHLAMGILLVGCAPSSCIRDDHHGEEKPQCTVCAIHPREGRKLSYLLVFVTPLIHLVTFQQRITYSYASWDDFFDFILIATLPYTLHYLLASNSSVLDERWRRSLPWILQVGTSPAEERTLRGASFPMTLSLLGCMAFQHRYLVPLCARASYIINGHDGVVSSAIATSFLTLGTILAYATAWFFGRKDSSGEYLLGEYHEDAFQLLLACCAISYGLSCRPRWTFLPVPMLFAESLALWIITKQLRYAALTGFVLFTVGTILVAYRLTFLNEVVELLPGGRTVSLKRFAEVAMYASIWLILLVGLVIRAQGGYAAEVMRRYDVTGIFLTFYGLLLVVMEFALLREPMPLYSRDKFEVGRVAVYTPGIAYFTGFLLILITWHLKAQKLIKEGSVVVSTSFVIGKMLSVLIESNLDSSTSNGDSLGMLFLRWAVASLLLVTISAPHYLLQPIHVKMSMKKRRDPSAKATQGVPKNASSTVVLYCAVVLPLVIVSSVRLVLEPLVGLLTGRDDGGGYSTTPPKVSEIVGYSASLWGISVLSMINRFLPDGGMEVWRRVSALMFVMGLFVSFIAPAFPGSASKSFYDDSHVLFQSLSSLDDAADNDAATGGWGLVSAFLAILLAMVGPLELREMRDAAGRRDTRQLLRLMIFGMMFGCGLSWFITMQSMSKDIFVPIFVTTFSCMAMSTLGTVAAVMGFFLEARDFVEAEQIANVWVGVGFPVFFVISSISLSAHAHPFGIGGWASTYLSVCGLLAGAFCVMVRLREDKTSTTRGYGNAGCVVSWLCAIVVVYGRYGVAGVGVVGTTRVAGIPASVVGTVLCAPILLLLEGEGSGSVSRKKYQASSTKSKKKGLVLSTLTRSNWFAPLLAGTVAVFLASSFYAIFLRGCGIDFSWLFGTGEVIKSQEDVFSHVYGSSRRTTGAGVLDDVATMARKSVVHTRTMVAAAKLSGSGIWTSSNLLGPLMHILGLISTLPSLQYLVRHSWSSRSAPSAMKVMLSLPLNLLAMIIGRGIPSLIAAATIGLVGGIMQLATTPQQ